MVKNRQRVKKEAVGGQGGRARKEDKRHSKWWDCEVHLANGPGKKKNVEPGREGQSWGAVGKLIEPEGMVCDRGGAKRRSADESWHGLISKAGSHGVGCSQGLGSEGGRR